MKFRREDGALCQVWTYGRLSPLEYVRLAHNCASGCIIYHVMRLLHRPGIMGRNFPELPLERQACENGQRTTTNGRLQ